jgi:transposase
VIPAGTKVFLASHPVDFRKGPDGLMALVHGAGSDPFDGALYVFRAKRADRIKIVWWDGSGLCIFAKRPYPRAAQQCTIAGIGRWNGLDEGPSRRGKTAAISGLNVLRHGESRR